MKRVADFYPWYPDVSNANFNADISTLAEFATLASSASEPIPGRGEFFKHQLFDQRFLREYDHLAMIDDPGTGKTGAIQAYTEWAREQYAMDSYAPIHGTLVLVPGRTTEYEFLKQLVCKSNKGDYEERVDKSKATMRAPSTIMASKVRDFYQIEHYRAFANVLANMTDKQIEERFSNLCIFMDEVHSIHIDIAKWESIVLALDETYQGDPSKKYDPRVETAERERRREAKRRRMTATEHPIAMPVKAGAVAGRETGKKEKFSMTNAFVYYQLRRLRKNAKGCKWVIASATLMSRYIRDIIPLVDLVQPPSIDPLPYPPPGFDSYEALFQDSARRWRAELSGNPSAGNAGNPSADITDFAVSVLAKYLSGFFSYVRSLEVMAQQRVMTPVDPLEIRAVDPLTGHINKIDAYTIPIVVEEQREAVLDLWRKEGASTTSQHEKGGENFRLPEREASAFVFPAIPVSEGGTGTLGHSKAAADLFFDNSKNIRPERSAVLQKQFLKFFVNGDRHGVPLCKVTKAAQLCQTAPGACFVFSERKNSSDSVYTLGACLNLLYGFQEYRGEVSAFEKIPRETDKGTGKKRENKEVRRGREEGGRAVCAGSLNMRLRATVDAQGNQPVTKGVNRYAIIHGDVSETAIENIIELFNSKENVLGDYIKAVIVTKSAEQSVSFSHVTRAILLTAQYTESEYKQIIMRYLRATSHVDLQDLIRARGGAAVHSVTPITIELYPLIAYLSYNGEIISADADRVKTAREENFYIARMERVIKRLTINCSIHHERNLPAPKYNNTATCDFSSCEYSCVTSYTDAEEKIEEIPAGKEIVPVGVGKVVKGLNYSNYNAVYIDEVSKKLQAAIANIFTKYMVLSIPSITHMLRKSRADEISEPEVISAIDAMMVDRVKTTDWWGRPVYIARYQHIVYNSVALPIDSKPEDLYYIMRLFATTSTDVKRFVSKIHRFTYGNIVENILYGPKLGKVELVKIIQEMREEAQQTILLQTALSNIVKGGLNRFVFKRDLRPTAVADSAGAAAAGATAGVADAEVPADYIYTQSNRLVMFARPGVVFEDNSWAVAEIMQKGYWIVEFDPDLLVARTNDIHVNKKRGRGRPPKTEGMAKQVSIAPYENNASITAETEISTGHVLLFLHRLDTFRRGGDRTNVAHTYFRLVPPGEGKSRAKEEKIAILPLMKVRLNATWKPESGGTIEVEWLPNTDIISRKVYYVMYRLRIMAVFEFYDTYFAQTQVWCHILGDGVPRLRDLLMKEFETNEKNPRWGLVCNSFKDYRLAVIGYTFHAGYASKIEMDDALAMLPDDRNVLLAEFKRPKAEIQALPIYALKYLISRRGIIRGSKDATSSALVAGLCADLIKNMRRYNAIYDLECYILPPSKSEQKKEMT